MQSSQPLATWEEVSWALPHSAFILSLCEYHISFVCNKWCLNMYITMLEYSLSYILQFSIHVVLNTAIPFFGKITHSVFEEVCVISSISSHSLRKVLYMDVMRYIALKFCYIFCVEIQNSTRGRSFFD